MMEQIPLSAKARRSMRFDIIHLVYAICISHPTSQDIEFRVKGGEAFAFFNATAGQGLIAKVFG